MDKAELAVAKHRNGYNCCQAVACVFADEVGIDNSTGSVRRHKRCCDDRGARAQRRQYGDGRPDEGEDHKDSRHNAEKVR